MGAIWRGPNATSTVPGRRIVILGVFLRSVSCPVLNSLRWHCLHRKTQARQQDSAPPCPRVASAWVLVPAFLSDTIHPLPIWQHAGSHPTSSGCSPAPLPPSSDQDRPVLLPSPLHTLPQSRLGQPMPSAQHLCWDEGSRGHQPCVSHRAARCHQLACLQP